MIRAALLLALLASPATAHDFCYQSGRECDCKTHICEGQDGYLGIFTENDKRLDKRWADEIRRATADEAMAACINRAPVTERASHDRHIKRCIAARKE